MIEVRSESNPTRTYKISWLKDGSWTCTCGAWKFQKKSPKLRSCKHLRVVEKGLAQHLQVAAMQ